MGLRWRAAVLTVLLLATTVATVRADPAADCRERLSRLGQLCLVYARQHDGRMPARLSDLYYEAYVNDLQEFTCPGQTDPLTGRTEIEGKSGYVLCTRNEGDPRPVIQDRSPANHGGQGVHVFFADGTVRMEAGTGFTTPSAPPPTTTPAPPPTAPSQPAPPATPAPAPPAPTPAPPAAGTQDVYLAQLKAISIREGGWGKTNFNRSITGGVLGIGGQTYAHGIGTHASSEIVYDISPYPRRYFLAWVGIDQAAVKPSGSCDFRVVVDGAQRYASGKLTNGQTPVPVQVDIAGARELKLVTTDAGDGIWYDQANWAEARLSDRAPGPPPVVASAPLPERLLQRPAQDTGIGGVLGQNLVMGLKVSPVTSAGATRPGDLQDVLEQLARDLLHDLGLDLPPRNRDPGGLRVVEVQSGGMAANWGLRPDDVLVALGARSLGQTSLTDAVAACKAGDKPKLVLVRQGQVLTQTVPVQDLPTLLHEPLPAWPGPDTGPQTRPPLTDLVLCQALDSNGRVVGPAARFPRAQDRVSCALWHQQAAPAIVQVIWYQDRTPCASCVARLEGTGRLTAVLAPGAAGTFAPGTYRVYVRTRAQPLATASFVIE